ncbi:MAG: ATP-dependent DNA helicase [Methanobrevibacter sp.]|jgi:Rad3-related DNA helicase|nr:ATP-dependent DNA helicase [Candidatus Methanovirga australis]
MSNLIFCPDCGMLKNNCVCGKYKQTNKTTAKITTKIANNNILGNDNNTRSGSFHSNDFRNNNFNSSNGVTNELNELNNDRIDIPYSIEGNLLSKEKVKELKLEFPHISEEIIRNFPFEHPRKGQLDIISDIEEAILEGYKYIVLEAGTGTGKSAVATTLSKMYGSAYILTMTKQLQSQYMNEFKFPIVKGRSNFDCLTDDLDSTCDMGACKTAPNSKKFFCKYGVGKNPTLDSKEAFEDSFKNSVFFNSDDHCNYWDQKANAISSPITLMNYDYAILELNYVKHFGKRDLLILDEAHNIEDKLMRILELNLYNKRLEKDIKKTLTKEALSTDDPNDWILEIEAIAEAYDEISLSDLPINKVDRIKTTTSRLKQLKENLEKEPKNWVIDTTDVSASFKPLRINNYAKDYLFEYGEVCIFLSATILSHRMFAKWLGIKPNELYHIKIDSPFPANKRPIELNLAGKMSKNRIKSTAPKTLKILDEILKKHSNDRGLIHTHSYKCQQYITNKVMDSRLISHGSQNRERILRYFERSEEPLVLVSPSMSEGVDLPYDKCRFQVIYKVPFPYLGDKQVNQRRKRDRHWYAYKTIMTLMQAYGRGMRAEDDFCHTYILDEDINMLFKSPMYKSLVPEFFKEAIVKKN